MIECIPMQLMITNNGAVRFLIAESDSSVSDYGQGSVCGQDLVLLTLRSYVCCGY